jgi:2-isopropylmalate synthase
MSKERLYLYDTTLRDGAQTTGVDFSLSDKRRLMRVLDDLGLDYIEGGYPGANSTDSELFSTVPDFKSARFTVRHDQALWSFCCQRSGPAGTAAIES